MPEALSQAFLDAAVARLRRATPRDVRVRAWVEGPFYKSVPGEAQSSVPPWEPEPDETLIWIEVRWGWLPWSRETQAQGTPLAETTATEILKHFLVFVSPFVRPRVLGCDPKVEVGSEEIRWWYDGHRVLELEPLPRDLLPDESDEGDGGAGVREPRRPLPNGPSTSAAIDPAA